MRKAADLLTLYFQCSVQPCCSYKLYSKSKLYSLNHALPLVRYSTLHTEKQHWSREVITYNFFMSTLLSLAVKSTKVIFVNANNSFRSKTLIQFPHWQYQEKWSKPPINSDCKSSAEAPSFKKQIVVLADQISSNVLTDPVCQISLFVVSLLNTGGD